MYGVENEMTREERVRAQALSLAIVHHPAFNDEQVVAAALRFEAYIRKGS